MVSVYRLTIWSPGKPTKRLGHNEFARLRGEKFKDEDGTLSCLLTDGWEPYSSPDVEVHFFRRKLNS
jgi:hypothetical protein